MQLKKHIIIIIMFLFFMTSCVAVYFALKYNNSASKNSIATDIPAKNTSSEVIALINEKTEIVKNYKYKDDINKQFIEKPGPEILGMDREGARKYFKNQNFLLTEFTEKRLTLLSQSDIWAPNYYVVKSDKVVIVVYKADIKGELRLEFNTEIKAQELPLEDRKVFEEGKAFENIDSVYEMLDELKS